jgi:transposase
VNTIEEEAPLGRRRRRRYSVEFKAQVVAACQGPGVSLAAIALHHKLNANLLRRWVEQAERNDCVLVARSDVGVPSAAPPAFVPLPLETRSARTAEIRVEVRRADQSITVS